jgi:hypothetical protein
LKQMIIMSRPTHTKDGKTKQWTKEDWRQYFEKDFKDSLHSLHKSLKSDSACDHCRAPRELRVNFSKKRDLIEIIPNTQLDLFLSCWFSILLISQGLHRYFKNAHPRWQEAVFCPLPVHPVGMGCVQVTPYRKVLRGVQIAPEDWDEFIRFFQMTVLTEVARLTEIDPTELIRKIYDAGLARNQDLTWHESKLLTSCLGL